MDKTQRTSHSICVRLVTMLSCHESRPVNATFKTKLKQKNSHTTRQSQAHFGCVYEFENQ